MTTEGAAPGPRRRTLPVLFAGIGAGVAVGVIAALVTTGGSNSSHAATTTLQGESALPADHRANATAFLQAWDRFRHGTFVVDLQFERTVSGKTEPLVSGGTLVQEPPRRLVTGFGNDSELSGDASQSCDTGADGTEVCAAPHSSEPYDVSVARELSILSQYFSGDTPVYRVEAPSPGCFRLLLYRPVGLAPYGDAAQFCFDRATGAMTLFEKTTDGGAERVTSTGIETAVTDADFARR